MHSKGLQVQTCPAQSECHRVLQFWGRAVPTGIGATHSGRFGTWSDHPRRSWKTSPLHLPVQDIELHRAIHVCPRQDLPHIEAKNWTLPCLSCSVWSNSTNSTSANVNWKSNFKRAKEKHAFSIAPWLLKGKSEKGSSVLVRSFVLASAAPLCDRQLIVAAIASSAFSTFISWLLVSLSMTRQLPFLEHKRNMVFNKCHTSNKLCLQDIQTHVTPTSEKTWCSDTIAIHSSKPQRKLVSWRHKKAAARTGMSTFTLAWSCSIASAKLGFTHGIWAAEAVASPSGLPGFESESGPFGTSPSAVSPGMSSMASGTLMKCPVFADGCVAGKSQPTF